MLKIIKIFRLLIISFSTKFLQVVASQHLHRSGVRFRHNQYVPRTFDALFLINAASDGMFAYKLIALVTKGRSVSLKVSNVLKNTQFYGTFHLVNYKYKEDWLLQFTICS